MAMKMEVMVGEWKLTDLAVTLYHARLPGVLQCLQGTEFTFLILVFGE
jgi:hypothetical protein